jgi:hypothetical protein
MIYNCALLQARLGIALVVPVHDARHRPLSAYPAHRLRFGPLQARLHPNPHQAAQD